MNNKKVFDTEFEEIGTKELTWYEKLGEQAKEKYNMVKDWCKNNKELICVIGPVVIGSGIEIMKIITKRSIVNEQQRLKENYIYDRSNGHYFELRRPPKASEWIEIDERKRQGQPLGEILQDMRLLK